MTDNSIMVSQLPNAQNVASTDGVVILYNALANASVRTISFSTLCANIVMSNTVPANSTANGLAGTFAYDNTHFYICVSNNVWARASLASW